MSGKIKIIATIGPASENHEILAKLKDRGVDFFRINLSHTNESEIENKIIFLKSYGIPIIVDTEGNQIRSGNLSEIDYIEGENIKLHTKQITCDSKNLFLNPPEVISNFQNGDLISIDFNSLLLKVFDISTISSGFIQCKIIIGGHVGGRKAVHVDSPTFNLFPLSKKDLIAIDLAKKHSIRHFTLSFMESEHTITQLKTIYPDAIIYSKIESKNGLNNFIKIARVSDGILIDRGDLSNQIPIERIPLIQKYIINKCRQMGKEIFVATNTLETMSVSLKPNRAEVNDLITMLLDGVTGIALTKETAVGKYPVETVNMVNTLLKQIEFIRQDNSQNIVSALETTNYLYSEKVPGLLIEPHGGKLINRISRFSKSESELPKKRLIIEEETLMDVEQIAIGSFSPLEGFLCEDDFYSVVDKMRLANGIIWPIPIILAIDEKTKNTLKLGDTISLVYKADNRIYATMNVESIYKVDKEKAAKKIYGTIDISHPGVKRFMELGDYFIGGKISLIKRRDSQYKLYELTPSQTRKIFAERGWSKVLGFHTRNAIHRSHEFIQMEGLKRSLCDGLFVHPIIGKKKSGDFEAEVIIQSYEKMIELFYPKSKVLLCSLATFSRYAGPREAIFTALIRKNFGCSHFIVGRDHTGVGNFYSPEASHEIFDKFQKEELGIIPIKFGNVFFSSIEGGYIQESEYPNHPEDKKMHISGTQAREILKSGKQPPEWFMRPEISSIITEKIKKGEKVFIE